MDYRTIPELEDYFDDVIETRRSEKLKVLLDYLREVSELIENNRLSTTDPEYIAYLDRYCSQSKHVSRIHRDDLLELLTPERATSSPMDLGDPPMGPFRREVVFGAFYMLIRVSLDGTADFFTLRQYLTEFEREFSDRPMYQYLRSEVYLRGFKTDHYRTAISSVDSIIDDSCTNPRFYSNFAQGVAYFYYSGPTESLNIDTLPNERSEVLSVAEAYSQKAVTLSPDDSEFHAIRSEILELMDDFETAEKEINRALELHPEEEDSDAGDAYNYYKQLNSLRETRRNAERADRALEEAKSELEEFKSSTEELENELKKRMERFRNQTLRSIGFFAGLIAVVVTSAQAILSTLSVAEASRVSLVLTGGLVVAFSGLGVVLSEESNDWVRLLVVAILGILLIGVGLLTPQLVNGTLSILN
ncbi:hypothetical protein [Halarchaeum sp. P4]|uniref:tetratricopeptide repeat protein n=1 Tax=Halarchaeum sp. P4 TaxID=3421639 RepID=UPI003EB77FE3